MDTAVDRPRWRFTLNYRLHPRLQVGVEYNPVVREVGPLLNLFLCTETEQRPALFFGTSSDRIGSPEGKQSYYLTVAKFLPVLPISAYASLNYSEWDERFNFPFGGTIELGRGFSGRFMYDGQRSHVMLNYFPYQFGISLMYIWLESAGISISAGF